MDIAELSIVMHTAQVQSDVGTAVMKQSLDSYETLGENMTKMMELSVTPDIGSNFDISV